MPKRGDNIHKRKDGRWEGRYKKGRKPDGTIIYGSIYGKSYHEIKDKLSQSDCSNKFETNASCKNLRDVLSLWMAQNRLRLKGGTINKYQNLIDTHILPELGSLQMKRIDVAIINAFLVRKKENGRVDGEGELSSAYVRGIALVLNSALKYAVQEGLCAPMKSSICKPTLEKQQVTVLSQAELQRLGLYVQGSDTTVCLGVAISLHTGLRIGEVCALQWEDIDFRNNILNVRHTVARIKDGKSTKLILDDGTELKSQQVAAGGSATPPVEPSRDGFIFAGWDGNYTNISKNTTITATYKTLYRNALVRSDVAFTVSY